MHFTAPYFASSALITVDVQNDFTLDGAPAQIPGTLAVLPNIKALVETYRAYRLPIVHLVRLYLQDGSNVDLCRRQLILDGTLIALPGSSGAELVDQIRPEGYPLLDPERLLSGGIQEIGPNETVVYKPRWGAFYSTPLEDHLRTTLSVDTVIFCGCNFPNCPRTSVYEASERDFRLVLATDAVSRMDDRGKDELSAIGVCLMCTQEIITNITLIFEKKSRS